MGLFTKLKNEFIDIIEWLDPTNNTIVYRFERYQNEIKMGAKLTVRESQVAVFINESIGDDESFAAFACYDVSCFRFVRNIVDTITDRQKEIVDAVNDTAGPDVPCLPVEEKQRQSEDTGLNGLTDGLTDGNMSIQFSTDDVYSTKDQGRDQCT